MTAGRALIALTVVLVVASSGAGPFVEPPSAFDLSPSASSPPLRELRMGTVSLEIPSSNPLSAVFPGELLLRGYVYSTLIGFGPNYENEPDLAIRWASRGAATWDLWLHHRAFWVDPRTCTADGVGRYTGCDASHPVTGADVAFTYNLYAGDPAQAGFLAEYARHLESAMVDPADPYHVTIAFDGAYAPALATFSSLVVLPEYIWSTVPNPLEAPNLLPVGSGPFLVRPDPSRPDRMAASPPLFLDRNPLWHGPEVLGRQIHPDVLRIESYSSAGSMSVDVAAGVLDLALNPDAGSWSGYLTERPGVIRQSVRHGSTGIVAVNLFPPDLRGIDPYRLGHSNPLLRDPVVRDALHMATVRSHLISRLSSLAEPADTLVPRASPWHHDFPDFIAPWDRDPDTGETLEEFPEDPAAARQHLHLAGWMYDCATGAVDDGTAVPLCRRTETGALVEPLQFLLNVLGKSPWWPDAMNAFVADVAAAGIRLDVYTHWDSLTFARLFWKMDFELVLVDRPFGPAGDPSVDVLSTQTCTNLVEGWTSLNGECMRDAGGTWIFDELYNETLRETDLVRRRALTDRLQEILYRRAGANVPFYRDDLYAMNEYRWTGWGEWSRDLALPPDVGVPSLLPQFVYPVDQKPPQLVLAPFEGIVSWPVQFAAVAIDPEGLPISYAWDFDADTDADGDGVPYNDVQGFGEAPTFTYDSVGAYAVALRVREVGGEWFTFVETTVRVGPPSAGAPRILAITTAPLDPVTTDPLVAFAASTVDPTGQPLTYNWHFGEDPIVIPDGPIARQAFPETGVFLVRLSVRTTSGITSEAATTVSVVLNQPPSVAPLEPVVLCPDRTHSFAAVARDPNPRDTLTFTWDFGDGSSPVVGNPVSHYYTQFGIFRLSVTVRDAPGGHSVVQENDVFVISSCAGRPRIHSLAVDPAVAYTDAPVSFTANVSDPEGDALRWQWDFNGDTVADREYTTNHTTPGQNVVRTEEYVYQAAGTYRARLQITDIPPPGYTPLSTLTSVTVSVIANAAPSVSVLEVTPSVVIPGEDIVVTFRVDDHDGDPLTYIVYFGDGTSAEGSMDAAQVVTVRHAYAEPGTFVVVVQVRDSHGGEDRAATLANVSSPGLLRVATSVDLRPEWGVPSKILVDGIPRDEWGLSWMKIAPGRHTVSFTDIPNLGTPPAVVVDVAPGQVKEVTGTFQALGWLRVVTDPPVPGTISVDGIPRDDWGLWMAMPPGTYTVSFGATYGYRPPKDETAVVVANALTTVVGHYNRDPNEMGPDPATFGYLRVTTRLSDGTPGVMTQILVDGIPRDEWGLAWLKLAPGRYTLVFSDVWNFGTPAPQAFAIVPGETTYLAGVFEVHGWLRVITDPAVPGTIFVDGVPRNDWGMWQSLSPACYKVTFGPVAGFALPDAQMACVVAGRLTTVVGHYVLASTVSSAISRP